MTNPKTLPQPASLELITIRADGVRVGDTYPWPTRDQGLRGCEVVKLEIKPAPINPVNGRVLGTDMVTITFAQGWGAIHPVGKMIQVWLTAGR